MSFSKFVRGYNNLLAKHPWKMQLSQSGIFMATGDVIAQYAVEKKKLMELEPERVARFGVIGTCIMGPIATSWFKFLDARIKVKGFRGAAKKLLFDQTCFIPFIIGVLSASNGFLQGHDFQRVKAKMDNDYLDMLKTGYMIWPWVQMMNFCFVPLEHRMMVVRVVALGWNTYLAWKVNNNKNVTSTQEGSISDSIFVNTVEGKKQMIAL